jgi:hypothetical protein
VSRHEHSIEVTRDGAHLMIHVPTLDDQAYTQAWRYAEVRQAAVDYLAVQLDADPDTIDIRSVTFTGIAASEILT